MCSRWIASYLLGSRIRSPSWSLAEISQSLVFRVETFFKISSLAALCEQACTEELTVEPRMLLSGQFIKHLTSNILQCNLQHIEVRFLEPLANAISEILRLGKWSVELSECSKLCQKLIHDYSQNFQAGKINVAIRSVERGHLGLLRKLLEGDDLHSQPRVYAPKPCRPAASLVGSAKPRMVEISFT
jgi:hypothetical protein